MPERYFLPFGDFAPDSREFDVPQLDEAKNALPIFGGKRPLRQRQALSSQATTGAITGAHAHLLLATEQFQYLRPDGTVTQGSYVALPAETGTLWDQVDEANATDTNRIAVAGAPANSQAELSLTDADPPGSTANHNMRARYKVSNYSFTSLSVTSITRVGTTATATTAAAHGLTSGDYVTVEAAVQTEYNITAPVTVTGATTFEYTIVGAPATPATGTITYKKSWYLKWRLREASTTRATMTVAGAADAGYSSTSYTLTGGEAGAIANVDDVKVQFEATVPGVAQTVYPTADYSNPGAWTTTAGALTGLYAEVDETAADDDTSYITTPLMAVAGIAKICTLTLPTSPLNPYSSSGHVVNFRYKALNAGITLIARLYQESTLIATGTVTNAATSYTDGTLTLSGAEADAITDYTALRLTFEASYPTATTATVFQSARPDADTANNGWLTSGGSGSNLYGEIDETSPNDADYVIGSGGLLLDLAELTLSDVTDPGVDTDHALVVRAKAATSGNSLIVKLYSSGSLVKTVDFGAGAPGVGPLTSSFQTFTVSLTEGEAALITSYEALSVSLTAYGSDNGLNVQVSYLELKVPELRKVRITRAYLALPSAARAEFSWFELSIPDPMSTFESDRVKLYAGSQDRLWLVNSNAVWEDVSRAALYAQGTDVPHSWGFASWGGDLLATNYVDAVQSLASGAADFANLITSTATPKSRFITVINQHVVLADIKYVGTPTGTSDMVWWSAVDDATNFDPSATTGCDYQRLRDIPGQIMGLVGGVNYGYVFKRGGIYKMQYVGTPFTFTFQNVALGVGTTAPRSIVQVDGAVYFWSGSGFYMLADDSVVAIGDGKVDRMLRDYEFESRAVLRAQDPDQRIMDSLVFGARCPHSGLIFWSYRSASGAAYRNDDMVVYNPRTGEWGYCQDSALDLAALASISNPTSDDTHLLSGLVGFDYTGSASTYLKFNADSTYAMTFRSKLITAEAICGEPIKNVTIQAVRPIFRGAPTNVADPAISVLIEGSDDPLLQDNVDSQTTSKANVNRDGWYPCTRVNGERFRFTTTVPALISARTIIDFSGLEILYEREGTSG